MSRPGQVLHFTRLQNRDCVQWGNLERTEGHQKGGGHRHVPEGYGPSQEAIKKPLVQILSRAETDPVSWTKKEKT